MAIELLAAVLMLTGVLAPLGAAVAVGFFLGATVLLAATRGRDPTASCGCVGARRHEPIRGITLARSGLLSVISAGALFAAGSPWLRITHPALVAAAALEWMVIGLLSPELRARHREQPDWARSRSLRKAVELVRDSSTFALLRDQLASTVPADAWREDDGGSHVVLFNLRPDPSASERYLAFAVAPRSNEILRFGELQLQPTVDGWKASHRPVQSGDGQSSAAASSAGGAGRSRSPANGSVAAPELAIWHPHVPAPSESAEFSSAALNP